MTDETISIDDILISDDLFRRSGNDLSKSSNLEAEIRILRALGQQLSRPLQAILKYITESVKELCQAGTAGVSLIETTPGGETVFCWVALVGAYEKFEGHTSPGNFSLCSVCLEQGSAQLYSHPERYFPDLQSLTPPPAEVLVVPLRLEQRKLGTIWIVAHDQQQFDREDLRILTTLAEFLSVAISNAQSDYAASEAKRDETIHQQTAIVSRQNEELTDLKQMQAALHASEARFQTLVRNMPGMVYRYHGDTDTFSYVSSGSRELFELEPEALLQDANILWELIYPDDLNSLKTTVATAVQNSLPWQWEGRVITPSGQLKWIQGNSRPQEVNDGTVWDGLLIDITDRKQAENALHNQKARLQLIIESAKDYAIFTLDLEGYITSWNSGAQRLVGYEETEIVGQSGRLLFTPEDIVMREHEKELYTALTRGRKENERWHVRKDGSRFWGSGLVMPLSNEDNSICGFLKILQDKTTQRQSEEEREQFLAREQAAREQAETANRIKDEFLAVLSHELRSPLNPILGWISLLRKGKLDAARTAHALETIERNAQLQVQLIEDLLDVSRILSGKLHLTPVPVNLVVTIEAALETVQLAAEAKSIQIQTSLDPSIGQVLGDTARLQQIVWNLLSNAVKFTPVGGQVNVRLERGDGGDKDDGSNSGALSSPSPQPSYARITVSDTGKGIAPEFLPYVFDYFRQADSTTTRRFGGLGLGLAIVRHLAELHGGSVQVESPGEGQGATFTVRLPLRDEPGESRGEQNSPSILAPDPFPLAGIQILLVDDEADTRELITFTLEQGGAIVTSAASAIEALATVSQTLPDVLISDIGMPEMDGYALIRQVRAMPQGEKILAIALTAYAGQNDQQQAIAAGFQKHITKPVEPAELIQTLIQQLNRK